MGCISSKNSDSNRDPINRVAPEQQNNTEPQKTSNQEATPIKTTVVVVNSQSIPKNNDSELGEEEMNNKEKTKKIGSFP